MQFIEVVQHDGIAEITLNRPKVNAMSQALLSEMKEAFTSLATDPAVKGALVRGAGKCVSAGLDLKEVTALDEPGLARFLDEFDAAFEAAFRFPKPLAAVVHGHAIAGGTVLAMCADYIALGEGDYKMGLTELAVGVPFPRVAYEIVRSGASERAFRKLVFGADVHSPAEMFAMGIGDALTADPNADARRWLTTACARPAATFRLVKAMSRRDAWDRIASAPIAERRALMDAIFRASQSMIAAVR